MMVAFGERLGLPWPTLLTVVIAGAIFLPGLPSMTIPPDLMLPIFLPPLLWALARKTSWAVIKTQLTTVISLSVLLVIATIAAVTGTVLLMYPTLGVAAAVVIGAALAPPDPVAVDAVAETTAVPRRLTSTLQMEGLFNDAASIVSFHVALAALLAGEDLHVAEGVRDFVLSVVLAVVIGLIAGWGAAKLSNWMESTTARTAFTWIVPFAVYIAAEEAHASGVIAIVIAAVQMNSKLDIGAQDRLSGSAFWETVEMVFTGLAFGLIGLSVRDAIDQVGTDLIHAALVGLVISVVLFAVRFVWMFGFYWLNRNRSRRDIAPLRLQEVLMLTWAGMRGLVSLALVLSIPYAALPNAHELSMIALVVLLCTMVIPGMTLPWLLSKLDLASGPDAAGDEAREALILRGHRAALRELYRHTDDLPPQLLANVENWLTESTDARVDAPTAIEAYKRARAKKALIAEGKIVVDSDGVPVDARSQQMVADKAGTDDVSVEEHVEVPVADLIAERMAYASQMREQANAVRVKALRAAQQTLWEARQEPGNDPAIVDEVLRDVDRMLLAAKRGS
ncbi:cation:proton antiporter [Corynebacterium zhongnanshanii]